MWQSVKHVIAEEQAVYIVKDSNGATTGEVYKYVGSESASLPDQFSALTDKLSLFGVSATKLVAKGVSLVNGEDDAMYQYSGTQPITVHETNLKKQGMWVVGTVADEAQPLAEIDFRESIVLVVGSEGRGLREKVAELCDFKAHIPMPGQLGSLNASVAGGICLYEAVRQRTAAP